MKTRSNHAIGKRASHPAADASRFHSCKGMVILTILMLISATFLVMSALMQAEFCLHRDNARLAQQLQQQADQLPVTHQHLPRR